MIKCSKYWEGILFSQIDFEIPIFRSITSTQLYFTLSQLRRSEITLHQHHWSCSLLEAAKTKRLLIQQSEDLRTEWKVVFAQKKKRKRKKSFHAAINKTTQNFYFIMYLFIWWRVEWGEVHFLGVGRGRGRREDEQKVKRED